MCQPRWGRGRECIDVGRLDDKLLACASILYGFGLATDKAGQVCRTPLAFYWSACFPSGKFATAETEDPGALANLGQPRRAVKNRTLYSTWNVSLALVRSQDAAELLRLVGYLGNQDLWYELLQAVANRRRFGYYSAGRVRLNLRAGRARRRQRGERGCRQRRRDENQDYTDLLSLSRQGLQNKQCFHDRSCVRLSATRNTGYQKHF
jgi:hypothetical protein